MINFKDSLSYKILKSHFSHQNKSWLRILLAIFLLAAVVYWVILIINPVIFNSFIIAITYWIAAASILMGIQELYYHHYIYTLTPKISLADQAQGSDWISYVNLADYLSMELARVLHFSGQRGQFNFDQFLEGLFKEETTKIILARAGLLGGEVKSDVGRAPQVRMPISSVEALLANAALKAVESEVSVVHNRPHRHIHISHVLEVLSEHNQRFSDLLFNHNVENDDLLEATKWFERISLLIRRSFFWEKGKVGTWGIGRDWAAGYTPTLSRYSTDLAIYIKEKTLQTQIIGRQALIDQMESALANERRANILLVGKPGVGKKIVINGLAARIASGDALRSLANRHILQIDVQRMIAGISNKGELEKQLLQVFNDAVWAGNIIVFIDNIHTLFTSEEGHLGSINAADIILPFLKSGRIQIIGTSTPDDYHNVLAKHGSIIGQFTKIDMEAANKPDAIIVLEEVALHLESQQDVFISFPVIKLCTELASRYISQMPLPESAIRILEAAAITASNRKDKTVTREDVEQAISYASRIPVGNLTKTEKEKLLNLETILNERVIGQPGATAVIASALKRSRSGIGAQNRPIGSFLFLGPTGVGKTETAKALAAAYFGDEDSMIRFDMSEFQTAESLAQLIGTSTKSQAASEGRLTEAVSDKPFSLILLDEIEKAHPDVLNIFLQIIDDGRATNGRGETVDFTSTMIIATSNAGSQLIHEKIKLGEKIESFREELIDQLQQQGIFRPEFINRFDAVVAYRPLDQDQLLQIIDLQLKYLNQRLKGQDIQLELTIEAKKLLAELGYKPEFGARFLKRVIQDKIENPIADKLLAGKIVRGDTISLDAPDIK